MTEPDQDAIRDAVVALAPSMLARVRELEQRISDLTKTINVIHAHRFDADRRDDPDHAAWLASFGETPAKRPDMFYAGVEYAVKRMNAALAGGDQ